MLDLPITDVLPQVRRGLADPGLAVLTASPGAGKTTVVPLQLLHEPWLGAKKIVMLEPRRLAARAAAGWMARTLGEDVGQTVGYRIRFDTRVSASTRLEIVTEGVLTRMLVDDPGLESTGLIIFDEFHERSLFADLGLALALESRAILRPDLRLLVMSATIDGAVVSRLLHDAPVISCPGRAFPVTTYYRAPRPDRSFAANIASLIGEALADQPGDMLVFLPGAGDISRVGHLLGEPPRIGDLDVVPLHGSLPAVDQDSALRPGRRRRVVLATAIAETSLTIEGIGVVIDGGRMRVPRFSARTGMSRLETITVSRASADQRRGRAGRTGPGVCYRMWSEADDAGLVPFTAPEILSSDLTPFALDLKAAGVNDPSVLAWLDPPPAATWNQALVLLTRLAALDGQGRITAHGRAMARLAMHPRLAHMVLGARALQLSGLAADLVSLLGDRDIARGGDQAPDADLRVRVESLRAGRGQPGFEVDRGALARARATRREWASRLGVPADEPDGADECGTLLAYAYPDRVAQRRAGSAGRFLLENGRGASLSPTQSLARAAYLVIADLDDRGAEARIGLAAPIDPASIATACGGAIARQGFIEWSAARRAVVARERTMLGAIVLEERPLEAPDPERVRSVLLDAIAREGLDTLPWTESDARLRQRLAFLHRLDPARFPDLSDAVLVSTLDRWLAPRIGAARSLEGVAAVDLSAALLDQVGWKERALIDQLAPERYRTPAGSRIAIDYSDAAAPVLAVRLQELFGLAETPSVAGGAVPLTLHLLSPARRPVQVTRDLAGFWRHSYFDVRKDLRGRYPKHHWPDNPLAALPARGTGR